MGDSARLRDRYHKHAGTELAAESTTHGRMVGECLASIHVRIYVMFQDAPPHVSKNEFMELTI